MGHRFLRGKRVSRAALALLFVAGIAGVLLTSVAASILAPARVVAAAPTCPPVTGTDPGTGLPFSPVMNGGVCTFTTTVSGFCGDNNIYQPVSTGSNTCQAAVDTSGGGGGTTCGNPNDTYDPAFKLCIHEGDPTKIDSGLFCDFPYVKIGNTSKCGVPPGSSVGNNGCAGSNAPSNTNCDLIPAGCAGSTQQLKDGQTKPDNCPYDASVAKDPDVCPLPINAPFRWFSCYLIIGLNSALTTLNNIMTTMLTIDTNQIFGTGGTISTPGNHSDPQSSGFYQAWSTFRNVGIAVVVIAAVIMVMAEALDWEIVDALTVRRTLPKIGVAVFLISISWPLMYYLITASNRIGHGTSDIILSSFAGVGNGDPKGDQIALTIASVVGPIAGFALFGFAGILAFGGAMLVALIMALLVLVFRDGIIILCVIIAPLALALYVLPNTARFSKLWWDLFLKSLLAFPIVTGLIAICKVMAVLSRNL